MRRCASVALDSVGAVSAPDIDQKVIDNFAALGGDARLTLVLGAGASVPSGLPTWNAFARRLVKSSGLVNTDEAADALLAQDQDPAIALEAAHALASGSWEHHLDEALYVGLPPSGASPSPLHLAVAGHWEGAPSRTTLATLNLDTLLETALLDTNAPRVVVGLDGRDEADAAIVHHLHGAVLAGRAYAPVVGYRDFTRLIADPEPWQRGFLADALQRGPLLLAGTSYRDPDIRHWLDGIIHEEGAPPLHPALVTIVREDLRLDAKTFGEIEEALEAEWSSIGLRVVTVQDFVDIAQVIRELRYVGRRGYRTPRERALRVWNAHRDRFAQLQLDYAKALETDSAAVGEATGARALRPTLWLANAHGRLARWASDGSRYRSIRQLKLVPTGHDSPLIAGEAIGSEEVKLKNVRRDDRVLPTWKSVLAVPIFVGDGIHPDFASAVLTFGLSRTEPTLMSREEDWRGIVTELSDTWGRRLSNVAFSGRDH